MIALQDDPRWIEHRDAHLAVNAGLEAPVGAHERYRQSLLPWVEMFAERIPDEYRKQMMQALVDNSIPLGVVCVGFRATVAESEFVKMAPPIYQEPVDEIARLRALPYGAYLKTQHWQKTRKAALERAEHRCQLCNTPNKLEVHHRDYTRKGYERPADVTVVCADCHARQHGVMRAA